MHQIDDQAAQGRAEKKTQLMRHRHQSLGLALGTCGHRFKSQRPSGGLNHRAADTLQEAKQNQQQL